MRLKQKISLLIASIMIVGGVGMMSPAEVYAETPTNTFTLTVPSDTNITKSGWNDIGNVGVTNVSLAVDKCIKVTITGGATGRTLKKNGSSDTVGYVIKNGTSLNNEDFGDSLEFTNSSLSPEPLGAVVDDFSNVASGTYEDTINFTATIVSIPLEYTLTGSNANGAKLKASELIATTPTSFTSGGQSYMAYNDFISKTSYANYDDAVAFVQLLNSCNYDEHSDWTLISSDQMAYDWWDSSDGTPGNNDGKQDFGTVSEIWSSETIIVVGNEQGITWNTVTAYAENYYHGKTADEIKEYAWGNQFKDRSMYGIGFVVIRKQ